MDVTLVLTHRCNLDCTYCYAGKHHRARMDDVTLDRALALLWADEAEVVQLSFFGGEPLLELPLMQRAVARAQAEAQARGKLLLLQCTTNGTRVTPEVARWVCDTGLRMTVSVDGVREAHDLTRPRAGGQSSHEQVVAGLRNLVRAGARPEALMVITPETVPFVYRSVEWLWSEGVTKVRANIDVTAFFSEAEREVLRDELVAVGRAELRRRLDGKPGTFEPFERGMRGVRGGVAAAAGCAGSGAAQRHQVVVATGGNLYPCAPMVREDRDDGPEAALRIGHLDDGAPAIVAAAMHEDAGCGDGKKCACSAVLETGDKKVGGPVGRWYAATCATIGGAVFAGLAEADRRRAEAATDAALPPAWAEPKSRDRRRALLALGLGLGGLAAASAGGAALVALRRSKNGPECERTMTAGVLAVPPEPPPNQLQPPGKLEAPPEPPPPGGLSAPPPPEPPPEIRPKGDIAEPPEPPPQIKTAGIMVEPPEPNPDVDGDMGAPPDGAH